MLKTGANDIVIMELYKNSDVVQFTDTPQYGPEVGRYAYGYPWAEAKKQLAKIV